ncbi:Transcriptional regulator AdcR [bacterium HR41]|nr:Transcriptional regulator AdcR [bacterium HR41]
MQANPTARHGGRKTGAVAIAPARGRDRAAVDPRSLARGLGALLSRLLHEGQAELLAHTDRHDLALTQIKLLGLLANSPEPPAVSDIAKRLGLSAAAASRAADGLVRRGLVGRERDLHDGRARRVTLTPRGRDAWNDFCGIRRAALERYARSLTGEQRAALAAALDALGLLATEKGDGK